MNGNDLLVRVAALRHRAWQMLVESSHFSDHPISTVDLKSPSRVCILASSSRGGTSVTSELLQWHAESCADPFNVLLTLPGEEKPYLKLHRIAPSYSIRQYDDLSSRNAVGPMANALLSDMFTDLGRPMAKCNNLLLYAIQLYRRLLLQWPSQMCRIKISGAISGLLKCLRIRFPFGYIDNVKSRLKVLDACVECFPFVSKVYYDCALKARPGHIQKSFQQPWSVEETPFVMPPPWRNATPEELRYGCLLLRDPSNAWRLSFWNELFSRADKTIIHLVRDPRESIQGLCDGWNYPFGFQTSHCSFPLQIAGYNDKWQADTENWKRHSLNFSVDKTLTNALFKDRASMSLVEICAHQWKSAHENIIRDASHLHISRTIVNFSDLCLYPKETYADLCQIAGVELSESGLRYVGCFSDRWVMTTSPHTFQHRNRWKNSIYTPEIISATSSREFNATTRRLNLPNASMQFDKRLEMHQKLGSVAIA